MKYTLRQLEVFVAVSHFENVSHAAQALNMSQSACSSSLKDLETQFDVVLFDRIGKRLQTNEVGKLLRPKAEAILAQARELEDQLVKHEQVGRLNIGATLTIGNYLCVNLINQFIKSDPNVQIRLEVANTTKIVHEILNFDIDLGMIEGEFHHPELHIVPWLDDQLVCFCAPNHPLASKQNLSLHDVQQAQWILREPGSGTRQTFDRAFHGLLPQLNIVLELQHTEAIKRAVESGMGISCLSRIALADAFQRSTLIPLTTPDFDLRRTLYLALHKQKYLSGGILRWLDLCGIPNWPQSPAK